MTKNNETSISPPPGKESPKVRGKMQKDAQEFPPI